MIVPEYWAEARRQVRHRRRSVTVRRFGWSDLSLEAAQAHAETRVQQAMDAILAGESLPRRERRTHYGVEGVPIREQVVAREGDDVITRNSYGALCLNTPDVLFADIDLEEPPSGCVLPFLLSAACWLGVMAIVGVNANNGWIGAAAATLALVLLNWLVVVVRRVRFNANGGAQGRALAKLEQFARQQPDWTLRTYRTPAGLRVLVMHAVFDPQDKAVHQFFKAVHADPLYARMCRLQHCFRARLTPKPWRMGMKARIQPRVAAWSPEQANRPDRLAWIADYERQSPGFAACQYLRTFGETARIHPRTAQVRALHDHYSRAESRLPMA